MEKVSVIVPVYNGEKSVKRCSDSILNQDYPELELILVDDGSRDRSWDVIQAIASKDSRVNWPKQAGLMFSLRMLMTGCRWTQQSFLCGTWRQKQRNLPSVTFIGS